MIGRKGPSTGFGLGCFRRLGGSRQSRDRSGRERKSESQCCSMHDAFFFLLTRGTRYNGLPGTGG